MLHWKARVAQTLILLALFVWGGCGPHISSKETLKEAPPKSLARQAQLLGNGLSFHNPYDSLPEGATNPEAGAKFSYDRSYSSNSRKSPVGIEIWIYDDGGQELHKLHEHKLKSIYEDIYGWDPQKWKAELEGSPRAEEILRLKSDLFWESLAQQFAERVFDEALTPALYRFGPHCLKPKVTCQDPGIPEVKRLVIKTSIDGRRDPMNPVTRSIFYDVVRGDLEHPELMLELQIVKTQVAGSHRETVDYRPLVVQQNHRAQKADHFTIWAHLPRGSQTRTKNTDYPDYNLLLVPLRHLVLQGEVPDPMTPDGGMVYATSHKLFQRAGEIIAQLRTPEGGQKVAKQLIPFLTPKYYYMFEEGGQGLSNYRSYILGDTAGIGKGLNPDFGRIEIVYNRVTVRSF